MRLIFCLILLVVSLNCYAEWDWAHSIGGSNMDRIWDMSCDSASNILVCGDFSDTLWVNGTPYPGYGISDSFVIKYSSDGEVLWVKTFGSTGEDVALGIGTDSAGNCYVGGYFVDTLTCQNLSAISYGMWDAYVLKLDPQGNALWLRSFGGTLNDIGYGLCVTPEGRVYVAGWFADSVKFTATSSIVSAGGSDVFCCAWGTDGTFAWAKRGGSEGVEYGYEVACDNFGNAYVTGSAGSGSQFGEYLLSGDGMFVCKYSPSGEVQWLSSSQNAGVIGISVQPELSGTQYGVVCGRLTGMGAIGNFSFSTNAESDDAYWAKFAADTGTWQEMQYYGGSASDKGKDCDSQSYTAYLASFEQQVSFGGINLISNGGSDIALGYGNLNSMHYISAGGQDNEVPTSIKILPNAKIAIAGWHYGACQFGSHAIDSNNSANQNAFVACYNPQSSSEDLLATPTRISASPNPFHDSINITASKVDNGKQNVKVYNMKGQLMRKLSPQSSSGKEIQYCWDGLDEQGRNCGSGVYLIQGHNSRTKVIKLN
ncbi:MAG: T9SS type A sorting domain-containing protein [Candidatus Cloacimonetes bacterium]|nr:T9SS type A sorting domain-containing protein [Candidatus Cloacimonadota bacterium]